MGQPKKTAQQRADEKHTKASREITARSAEEAKRRLDRGDVEGACALMPYLEHVPADRRRAYVDGYRKGGAR